MFFSVAIQAQQIVARQDFGVWVGVVLKKKLPLNFEISLEQQLRTCLNTTKLDNYWAALGITYTINKNFRLNGNARYIHDVKKWKATENSLRYNVDLEFRTRVKKKFQLFYRLRYQQKFIDFFHRQRTKIAPRTSAIRNKIRLLFKYKKAHKFYVSSEFFVTSEVFREAYADKLRFCLGDKIKTKVGSFNCALGYEVNVQANNPFSFFFLKVVYLIRL